MERDGVKRWQDSIVLAVMLVVLVVGTTGVYFASPKPGNSGPALSTYSSDPGGAMAFHRWLGDLGFDVTTIEDDPFFLPDDVNALIVLTDQTTLSYSASEARTLAGWIGRGHLALVGTDTIGQPSLMQALGLRVVPQGGATLRAPVQPLLLYPPVHSVSDVPALGLEGNDDFVGLIPASGQRGYLFLTKRIGSGALYVCSAPKLFSNQLIVEEAHRLLALNVIGAESPGARLAFDEYHHNYIHRRSQSLTTVIVSAFWVAPCCSFCSQDLSISDLQVGGLGVRFRATLRADGRCVNISLRSPACTGVRVCELRCNDATNGACACCSPTVTTSRAR